MIRNDDDIFYELIEDFKRGQDPSEPIPVCPYCRQLLNVEAYQYVKRKLKLEADAAEKLTK